MALTIYPAFLVKRFLLFLGCSRLTWLNWSPAIRDAGALMQASSFKQAFPPKEAVQLGVGWEPTSDDSDPWIESDFSKMPNVFVQVSTWANKAGTTWVSSYRLKCRKFSSDEIPLSHPALQTDVFMGNHNALEQKINAFSPQLCTSVRLYPVTWVTTVALRWSLAFCKRKSSQVFPYNV